MRPENNAPLETETSAWQDCILEVPAYWTEKAFLHHASHAFPLLPGLLGVDFIDKANSLAGRKIGPVDTLGREGIIWVEMLGEDCSLVLGAVLVVVMGGSRGDDCRGSV